MSQINTIIFDLSEVYLSGLKGVEYSLESYLGFDKETIKNSLSSYKLESLFHGKISEEEYLKDVIDNNNWNITVSDLKNIIRKNFIEIDGTRYIIQELKNLGYKLGLLSVHAREWVEYCDNKYDYHNLFDYTVYSFDIGISKPDERSFLYIIELIKEKPENTVFIDDNIENVESSINLGMNGILFEDTKQLRSSLKELNIL